MSNTRWFDDAPRVPNTSAFGMFPALAGADTRLSFRQLRVLLALFLYAKLDTGRSYVAQSTIAEYCGFYVNKAKGTLDQKSVSECITALRAFGWVTTVSRGVGETLIYTLAIPSDAPIPALTPKRLPDSDQKRKVKALRDSIETCEAPSEDELNAAAEANFRVQQKQARESLAHSDVDYDDGEDDESPTASEMSVALAGAVEQPTVPRFSSKRTDVREFEEPQPSNNFHGVTREQVEKDDWLYQEGLPREYGPLVYQKFGVKMSKRGGDFGSF